MSTGFCPNTFCSDLETAGTGYLFWGQVTDLKPKPQRNYRNPICLAKEYKWMVDSGQARNESDLARQIGVSRVTINHFITLLKLTPEVIQAVEEIGDPMPKRYITERKQRSIVKMPSERQKAIVEDLTLIN